MSPLEWVKLGLVLWWADRQVVLQPGTMDESTRVIEGEVPLPIESTTGVGERYRVRGQD